MNESDSIANNLIRIAQQNLPLPVCSFEDFIRGQDLDQYLGREVIGTFERPIIFDGIEYTGIAQLKGGTQYLIKKDGSWNRLKERIK